MQRTLCFRQEKEAQLKTHLNELANENADLRVTVARMRYRPDEAEPEPEPEPSVIQPVSTHHLRPSGPCHTGCSLLRRDNGRGVICWLSQVTCFQIKHLR